MNRNRLSNVRFPLGEEPWPDMVATDGHIGAQHVDGAGPDDQWFNLKVEQHLPKEDPKQKHLLHGGPELRIKCDKCDKVLHIAGEKPVREVLEEANYYLDPKRDWKKINTQTLVVACCESGHVTQLRGDVVARLVKRS